jgi:hypothetical protein
MIDIDKLEALAKAAGGDEWTPTYGTRLDPARVWLPDGDGIAQCFSNIGHQPEPIDADDVAEYIGSASPANVLALIAEVRALREDAERWRWIRQGKSVWVKVPVKEKHVEYFIGHKPEPKFPECFDKAVDAARGSN